MPHERRPSVRIEREPAGRCAVLACVVCAVEAEQPPVTVAEWLVGRLRPAVGRARERWRRGAARRRARQPAAVAGRWPYSAWWAETGG